LAVGVSGGIGAAVAVGGCVDVGVSAASVAAVLVYVPATMHVHVPDGVCFSREQLCSLRGPVAGEEHHSLRHHSVYTAAWRPAPLHHGVRAAPSDIAPVDILFFSSIIPGIRVTDASQGGDSGPGARGECQERTADPSVQLLLEDEGHARTFVLLLVPLFCTCSFYMHLYLCLL
jgi:hypothetical protein